MSKGWDTWPNWLNTIPKKWGEFQVAREFVRSLKLKNRKKWRSYIYGHLHKKGAKPEDIPNCPEKVYKDKGWINLKDWLGTE